METKTQSINIKISDISGIEWKNWSSRYPLTINKTIVTIPITCASTSTAVAFSDETGQLYVWKNFDCIKDKIICGNYSAHSSKIHRIVFTPDDKYLATIGINDNMICIWKTKPFYTDVEISTNITEVQLVNEANYSFESNLIPKGILGSHIIRSYYNSKGINKQNA